MNEQHPNVAILSQLDIGNLTEATELFSENFIWHFFNPKLPDVQGDYFGLEGLQVFFEKLAKITNGSFSVEPISIAPIGDELVVTHVRDRMILEESTIELDAVVVWRIVDGYIAEAWDIPAVNTAKLQTTD
ncbi:MAG: nuclear transport factor 2 family protein [Cyanobacteriota bacterium]|nr:nuclear transport factor 2 family protein [Cyanobacteriota bacterium]